MRARLGLALSTALAGGLLLLLAAPAQADLRFCPAPGTGAGECGSPEEIAVDTDAGNVYVADSSNNRISVFDSTGSFQFAFGWGVESGAPVLEKCTTASGCREGLAGSGAGQFNRPRRIAIDSISNLLYVVDIYGTRVQKFALTGNYIAQFGSVGECAIGGVDQDQPVAVGPTGFFYATSGGTISKYSAAGACEGKVKFVDAGEEIMQLAVDSGGDLWVGSQRVFPSKLRKFTPAGTQVCGPLARMPDAIASDGAGRIFTTEGESAVQHLMGLRVITVYDSATCEKLRRFGYGAGFQTTIGGVSPYQSPQGDVFAVEPFSGTQGRKLFFYLKEPPPGPIVVSDHVDAVNVSNTKATLRAEINAEGKETTYHFEYLTEEDYEAQGNSFAGPSTKSTSAQVLPATGFDLQGVETFIGCADPVGEAGSGNCLSPEATYRFRVVATNPDGAGEGTAEGDPFDTRGREILTTYATQVGSDMAVLGAEVNPQGIPTSGYFEYVDDATYRESGFAEALRAPAGSGELDFGAGEAPVVRSVTLSPLPSGTGFHYRLSLTDPLIAPVRFPGPERAFSTFATPVSGACPNDAFRSGPSGLLADCRAYELVSPLDKESGDVMALGEFQTSMPATLSQSSRSGDKLAYGSYRAFGDAQSAPFTTQYVAERGAAGWESHAITPPRGSLAAQPVGTLDTELKALSPDLCHAWLQTYGERPLAPGGVAGYRNLYRRHGGGSCGGVGYEALTTHLPAHKAPRTDYKLELQGLSADGGVSIYTANDNLLGTYAPDNPNDNRQLYRRSAAGTEIVCVLPGEVLHPGGCSAGTRPGGIESTGQNRGASVDGAISADGQRVFWTADNGPGRIYVRIGEALTIAVSEDGEAQSGTSQSIFLKGSEDGSKALYLTGDDLYEFEVDTETTTPIAGGVAGILGAAEDLSRIYLVSEEAIGGPNAEEKAPTDGQPNLYLYEGGAFTFVATLAAVDVRRDVPYGQTSAVSLFPYQRNSRLTSDGSHTTFMSFASLTGYDNVDAKSGETVAELFRYDAGAERLLCVSCNPTGGRPIGRNIARRILVSFDFWAAGWTYGWDNTLYASRDLSGDGRRVFFESSDTLSPRDTNGVTDVYQWQQPGTGTCTEASSSYSSLNGGCVDLVSSGQSARNSEFLDASPTGEDVFFSTLASLVPHDYGLIDVYDARAGGGLPAPPTPPVGCEGEACQPPPSAPSLPTPSSSLFQGPGDPKPAARKKRKGKSKAKGRSKAKRAKGRPGKRKGAGKTAKRRKHQTAKRRGRSG